MSELTEYLQSVPSHELTKKIASQVSERSLPSNPRRMVIEEFISLTKGFMADFFDEIRPDLEKHAFNYPFLRLKIPGVAYDSTEGRISYGVIQDFLRKVPRVRKGLFPRPVDDPVVPIILPGVDYSAESLLSSGSLGSEKLPDKSKLGWQHLDTYADYCMGLMTLGRETYAWLMDAWYSGNDSDLYFQGLETIAEETLHHISDKIAGPRYTKLAVEREHYWMKSYGEFPEKVDIALLRLKDEYLGRLSEKLSDHSTVSRIGEMSRPNVLRSELAQ
ncbi:MAG TPA: hypothetical protein VE955_10405 [Candidatus Dormibacteraeota bacterium]|jgi:hypothetical protein|nr:hypothetical protein [Candidatus Dormibacteraeota bacterium]